MIQVHQRRHRQPALLVISLLMVMINIGCGEQPPSTIEHRVYETNLLEASEEVQADTPQGKPKPPQHARHLRTRLTVPPNAIVSLNGRIVRHGQPDGDEQPLIGPVYFELRVDGE